MYFFGSNGKDYIVGEAVEASPTEDTITISNPAIYLLISGIIPTQAKLHGQPQGMPGTMAQIYMLPVKQITLVDCKAYRYTEDTTEIFVKLYQEALTQWRKQQAGLQ